MKAFAALALFVLVVTQCRQAPAADSKESGGFPQWLVGDWTPVSPDPFWDSGVKEEPFVTDIIHFCPDGRCFRARGDKENVRVFGIVGLYDQANGVLTIDSDRYNADEKSETLTPVYDAAKPVAELARRYHRRGRGSDSSEELDRGWHGHQEKQLPIARLSKIANGDYHHFLWHTYHYLGDVVAGRTREEVDAMFGVAFRRDEVSDRIWYKKYSPVYLGSRPFQFLVAVDFDANGKAIQGVWPLLCADLQVPYAQILREDCFYSGSAVARALRLEPVRAIARKAPILARVEVSYTWIGEAKDRQRGCGFDISFKFVSRPTDSIGREHLLWYIVYSGLDPMVYGTKKESSFTPRDILRPQSDHTAVPEKGHPRAFL